jgi:hypothetical protein
MEYPWYQVIQDDLKKDEDLFPTDASDFAAFLLRFTRNRERERPNTSKQQQNNSTTDTSADYNFSMTADAINFQ